MRRTLFALGLLAFLAGATQATAGNIIFENQCRVPVAGSVRNQLGDAIFQFYLDPGQVIRFSGKHKGTDKAMADLPWTVSAIAAEHFAAGSSSTALIRSPEARAVNITCATELAITVKLIPLPPSPQPAVNGTRPSDERH